MAPFNRLSFCFLKGKAVAEFQINDAVKHNFMKALIREYNRDRESKINQRLKLFQNQKS